MCAVRRDLRPLGGEPVSRPRVFDVFPLGYETDVLLLRLQTLADVVDEFCIVEGDRWYTGAPRGWLLPALSLSERFRPFLDRIHWRGVELPEHPYVDPEDMGSPYSGPAWQREDVLRGQMLPLVDSAGARPDDIVILSDADEIPNPGAIVWAQEQIRLEAIHPGEVSLIRLPGHYHQLRLDLRAVNSLSPEYLWEWRQPLIGRRRAFTHAQHDRAERQKAEDTLTVPPYVARGWHFTCQGTPADIAHKLRSYSHDELSDITADNVAGYIEHREAIGHHVRLRQVSLQEMPDPVRKDPQAWAHMLAQGVA